MLRRLYDWVMRLSAPPRRLRAVRHRLRREFILSRSRRTPCSRPWCWPGPQTPGATPPSAPPARSSAACWATPSATACDPVGRWLLAMTGHPGGEAPLRAAVRQMGRGGNPAPGPAADPLQADHHHHRPRALQPLAVRRRFLRHPQRALLRRQPPWSSVLGPALLPVIERRLALVSTLVVVAVIVAIVAVRLATHH